MKVKLSEIRIDGNTQSRAEINLDTVAEYAAALQEDRRFPPVSVFYDGAHYWLADGFHRYHAHAKIGAATIDVEISSGTQRDAWLYSLGANSDHGLRRTNADKRKAVAAALDDPELLKWSDNAIANQCNVSNHLVGEMRRAILENSKIDESATRPQADPVRTVQRNGTTYQQNTADIGKKSGAQVPRAATPGAVSPAVTAPAAPDPDDELDILESMRRRIHDLNCTVEALQTDDTAKELAKQIALREAVEKRLSDTMDQCARLNADLRGFGKWQMDLFRATGVESRAEVLRMARAWRGSQEEAA